MYLHGPTTHDIHSIDMIISFVNQLSSLRILSLVANHLSFIALVKPKTPYSKEQNGIVFNLYQVSSILQETFLYKDNLMASLEFNLYLGMSNVMFHVFLSINVNAIFYLQLTIHPYFFVVTIY